LLRFFKNFIYTYRHREPPTRAFYKKLKVFSRKSLRVKFLTRRLWFEWVVENVLFRKFGFHGHVRIINSDFFLDKQNFFKMVRLRSHTHKKIWRTRHKKLFLSLINFRFYYNPSLLVLDTISEFHINRRH